MRYPSCLVGCAEFLSRCAGKRDNRGGYTQCSDGEVPFPLQYLLFTPFSDNGVRRSGWQLKNGWYRLLFHLRRTYEYVWISKCPKWCIVIQGNPYSSLLQEKSKVEECGMRKVVSLSGHQHPILRLFQQTNKLQEVIAEVREVIFR